MRKKMIWGFTTLIILLLAGVSYIAVWQYTELQQYKKDGAEDDKLLEQYNKQKQTPEIIDGDLDASHPDFHVHEDGTPHIGTHDEPSVAVPFQPSAPSFSNFTRDPNDDPVTTAYKRLDYIKNNLHEWGNFSERTLELMDEMTPMSEPPKVEGDGGDTVALLKELSALRDPRSAEFLIKYQMESGIMGRPVDDALVAMGPASVPALIDRLDDLSGDSALSIPLELLLPIVAEHRTVLGGIVEHIIIPKLEAIAASTNTYRYYAEQTIADLLFVFVFPVFGQ